MMRYLIAFLLVVGCLVPSRIQAQDKITIPPDYKRIQKDVQDKKSARHYPKLVKRLSQGDPTLTERDYEALYYGWQFQENYNPYPHFAQFDEVRKLLNQDTLTQQDVQRIVSLADEVIADCPVELHAHYYKLIAYSYQERNHGGDSNLTRMTANQFWPLVNVIANSGDGLSPSKAMWVVATSHEYLLMNLMEAPYSTQSLSSHDGHTFDSFTLDATNQEGDTITLWFNIDAIWAKTSKMFDFDKENIEEPQRNYDPKKKVTALDIPFGTRVELELVKVKKGKSQFRVLNMEKVEDTLIADREKLFPDPIPEGRMVGYFVPAYLSEGSEKVHACFIFKANFGEPLEYDTEIQYQGRLDFQTTSNSGIYPLVMMNEMWNDNIQTLRISNIRK